MNSYDEFIETKTKRFEDYGIDVSLEELNPKLFDYEADIVKWALKKDVLQFLQTVDLEKQ